MSTLPRTRSLSGADTVSLSGTYRDRLRPASLCENSWHKVVNPGNGGGSIPSRLKRTPSQANSLATTVPTSLVTRNLSTRHIPTKTSLKHSRMFNVQQNKVFMVRRQQPLKSVGRIGVLVLAAQIFVGSAALLLACWLILWAPNLSFRVVPHYAGVPVLSSGVFGSILLCCLSGKRSCGISIIRAIVICLCCISILTCSCICVFTSLHLIRLAPMECSLSTTIYPLRKPSTLAPVSIMNPLDNLEGSGQPTGTHWDEDDSPDSPDSLPFSPHLELDSNPPPPDFYPHPLTVNKSVCVCEKLREGWRIVDRYDLSCAEVKNILPIFFVASIVVCSVGAVLCAVILYMLYIARVPNHRPSEARPFIYKSQFKNKGCGGANVNGSGTNDTLLYR